MRLVVGLTAIPSGDEPVFTVATTDFVRPSITVTELLPWLAMYALCVFSLTAIAIGCWPVAIAWAAGCDRANGARLSRAKTGAARLIRETSWRIAARASAES